MVLTAVLETLLPLRCPACGAAGPAPCARCLRGMGRPPRGPVPAGLDGCWSLLAYDGPARELVTRLKYRNHRAAVAWLADGMAALLEPPPGVVVTWAPTSERRRRARGFDQAELLAAAVARRWGVPCRRLLTRSSASPPQTGLSLAARRRGPTFAGAPGAIDAGAAILVDDVVTTG
ncbi:MAG TPA: hypothetical protein VE575_11990, partial [Acidimicrobiales bacterium]|nr:hypothetical protein [Acidimicrobiales bacterium]